jgi:hypothetical protein
MKYCIDEMLEIRIKWYYSFLILIYILCNKLFVERSLFWN